MWANDSEQSGFPLTPSGRVKGLKGTGLRVERMKYEVVGAERRDETLSEKVVERTLIQTARTKGKDERLAWV